MLALIKDGKYIKEVYENTELNIAGVYLSAAYAGWVNSDYSLHTIIPAPPVPADKILLGTTVEKQGTSWAYVNTLSTVAPPTIEEVRAAMPAKTPREFRNILVDLGLKISDITNAINSIPFEKERGYALNAWEVMTVATRTDPYIDMIGAMFNISPTEIDYAWLHGATE